MQSMLKDVLRHSDIGNPEERCKVCRVSRKITLPGCHIARYNISYYGHITDVCYHAYSRPGNISWHTED